MGIALLKNWLEEDPTFRVETNVETGETVISAAGCELHLMSLLTVGVASSRLKQT